MDGKGDVTLPEDEESTDIVIDVDEEGKIHIKAKGIVYPSHTVEYFTTRDVPRIFIGGLKNYWDNTGIISKAALIYIFIGLPFAFLFAAMSYRSPAYIQLAPMIIWVLAMIWGAVVGDRIGRRQRRSR